MSPTPNQWWWKPIRIYSRSLQNPTFAIQHTSTSLIRTIAWFQLPADYTRPMQTLPHSNTGSYTNTRFLQCLTALQHSKLPFQVCPQALIQILAILECPQEEKNEAAANITLSILHNFNRMLQISQAIINKHFVRFRPAINDRKLIAPANKNLKKCLKCDNHVHTAVLIPWLRFRPQGLSTLLSIYTKKLRL